MLRFLSAACMAAVMFCAIPFAGADDIGPDERVLGAEDAPVTIIEYASMTCPHCASFHTDQLPEIKEKYIDTGQVRLVFRDFPLDRLALAASMIARCAPENRYFALLDELFERQAKWATSEDPLTELSGIARMVGMSRSDVEACLADETLRDAVIMSRMRGEEQFDVTGTPSCIIDGEKYVGLSAEQLRQILGDMSS